MKTVQRDTLDLIPNADCRTKKMLQEYRQLGLLFTYNIDEEPRFCYRNQIVSSLVILESVADIILMGVFDGELVNGRSMELKDTIDAACNMETIRDESIGWMSRCVSRAIVTGINSIDFMRDLSSLVLIQQTELESGYKMTKETSQFRQFANSQAKQILKWIDFLKQKINKLFRGDEILLHVTNVTMGSLNETIEQKIHDIMAPGETVQSTNAFCVRQCDISIPV